MELEHNLVDSSAPEDSRLRHAVVEDVSLFDRRGESVTVLDRRMARQAPKAFIPSSALSTLCAFFVFILIVSVQSKVPFASAPLLVDLMSLFS